jgi:hypothetical protein
MINRGKFLLRSAVLREECNLVLDSFVIALNNHDAAKIDRYLHFPHVRFTGEKMAVYDSPGRDPMDLYEGLMQTDKWSYSKLEDRNFVYCSESKMSVALSDTRFRADGSVIGRYLSLFVLTRVNGGWGIQMRTSSGP